MSINIIIHVIILVATKYSTVCNLHVCTLSHLSCVQLFVTPWTVACQAPLSMEFSRQEYWSGLPCPPPEDLSDPGIEPMSLMSPALAGGFFTIEPPGSGSNQRTETQGNISREA